MFAIVFAGVVCLFATLATCILKDSRHEAAFGSVCGLAIGSGFWLGFAVCLYTMRGV